MKEFGFVYYASIHLESKYHNFLNCKLIDSLTSLPLSTFLINTAAETLVSINKHIEDFELILQKQSETVAIFTFDKADLEKQNKVFIDETLIKIKKQSDECSLTLIIHEQKRKVNFQNQGEGIQDENFYYRIAKEAYQTIKKSALKAIKVTKVSKTKSIRLSTEEKNTNNSGKSVRRTWTLFSQDQSRPRFIIGKRSKFYVTPQRRDSMESTKARISRKKKRPVKINKKKLQSMNTYSGVYNFLDKIKGKQNISKANQKKQKNTRDPLPKNLEVICSSILPKYWLSKQSNLEMRGSQIISFQPNFNIRKSIRKVEQRNSYSRQNMRMGRSKGGKKIKRFATHEEQILFQNK